MDHHEAGRYWEANAEAWTELVREGYDIYRDFLNTPAFFALLPDVRGLRGLDIGCGEGHNTRLLAGRGAAMTAMDISETFIRHARAHESQQTNPIDYRVASAVSVPCEDHAFDFATAFMSLMEVPETSRVLSEVHRVLKPGGFFQFSIEHPCFATPHRRNLRNASGVSYAVEVGNYFSPQTGEVSEWMFGSVPTTRREGLREFRVPRFTKTISQWLNLLVDAGFVIERVEEPHPTDEQVRACPGVQDAQVVAYFLHVRVRKPAA